MSGSGIDLSSANARLAAAGLTATTILLLTAGLSMLQPLSTDLYLSTLPGIATYFNASVASVQSTLWMFIAAFGVWQLVAGPLSDRFGRYPIVVAGAFTYCAASVLAMFAPSLEVLITGRILQAVGACTCLIGARGFVRDLYSPTEGARMIANAATIMSLAPLIGPLIGATLYVQYGWRSSFAVLAAFSLLLACLAAFKLRETNTRRNPNALTLAPMLRTYASVVRSPAFRAYTLSAAATYACLFAFLSGSSFVFINVLGQTPTTFALSFATMVVGYLIGTVICRRLLAIYGIQRTVCAGASLQAAAGLAMATLAVIGIHVPLAIGVPMFFIGVSHGLIQPPVQSGAVAPFPHAAGAASALLGFVMMLVATCVGIWIGASYDGTVYPLTLTICACGLASAAIAFTLVRKDGDLGPIS
ncbi:MAG TPA: multidrug effflux MFS transporter [Burkholderiaceae bacterium]|nr:multidrug effflux MFS transporter [Burkholderiaceae bacterium]